MKWLLKSHTGCGFVIGGEHDGIPPGSVLWCCIVSDDFPYNGISLSHCLCWDSPYCHIREDVILHGWVIVAIEVHEIIVSAPIPLFERWNPQPFAGTRVIPVIEISVTHEQRIGWRLGWIPTQRGISKEIADGCGIYQSP